MELLACLLMFGAAACWLRPAPAHGGQALEWRLLSAPLAAGALLIWLELHGDTGLARWALSAGVIAAAGWIAQSSREHDLLQRPVWAVGSVGILAAGLLWNIAGAHAAEPAANSRTGAVAGIATGTDTLPADELSEAAVPATQLETLVVTGEKLGRTLGETTTSVGLVTRDELAAGSDAAMKDIVTQFANVIAASSDREIAIRGVPQSGIGGEGETISVYLDGVALPARAASFAGPLSAWDLEQVEVLRGAQSTNQGRNSLAGSVILRSREPTPHWNAHLRTGAMSRDGYDYAIAGGGPLTDTLRFRIAAQDRYDNGDITNTTRNEDDAQRESTRNLRAKLLWTPDSIPGYRAQYGHTRAENEFGDPLHDSSGGERTETSNVRPDEEDTTSLHSLEQSLAFGDGWRIDSISGWTAIGNLYAIDFDRSAADGGYSDNTLDEDIFSQELRLHYTQDSFKAVLGGYHADAHRVTNTTGYDVAAAAGAALINGSVDSDSTTRTQAVFAEADWDFTETLRLTAGLRYNIERARRHDVSDLGLTLNVPTDRLLAMLPVPLPQALVDQLTALPLGVPLPQPVGDALSDALPDFVPKNYDERGRSRDSVLLPKIGLTWFTGERSALALTYQEGYRSGGTSISFFRGRVSPYEPETTRTVELAARSRWLEDRLTLNANLFHTRWRDQQVTIGESSGFETTTENAGRSHYYGMEAEALWKLRGPFETFVTAGLIRSEFDEFVNESIDYAGNRFPYAPEHTAALGLTLREWRRISGQVAVNYIGALYADADNDERTRANSRTLLHAKLGYRLPAGFSLAVFGRNLGDDPNYQGALVSGSRIASRYGEPRSVGVVLEWQS